MLHLSGQPNHLSPVDILLRNMERQQIQTSIDTQYANLASQMKQEAMDAINIKPNPIIKKETPPTLKELINMGVAKIDKPKNKISNKKGKKGKKKLDDEITKKQYFNLSFQDQVKYDRKMATQYDKLGLGSYKSYRFERKPVNKKAPKIIRTTPKTPEFFRSAY